MKKIVKMSLMVMAFAFVLFNGGLTAKAADNVLLGDSMENAIELKLGNIHSVTYTQDMICDSDVFQYIFKGNGWACIKTKKDGYYRFNTISEYEDTYLYAWVYDTNGEIIEDSQRIVGGIRGDEKRGSAAYRLEGGKKFFLRFSRATDEESEKKGYFGYNSEFNLNFTIAVSYVNDLGGQDISSATKIVSGKKIKDNIASSNDEDWYKIKPTQSGIYKLYPNIRDKQLEIEIYVYDENMNVVWYDYKGKAAGSSKEKIVGDRVYVNDNTIKNDWVNYKFSKNKNYYICVKGNCALDDYSNGKYTFQIKKNK